jgi:hypothetical protein
MDLPLCAPEAFPTGFETDGRHAHARSYTRNPGPNFCHVAAKFMSKYGSMLVALIDVQVRAANAASLDLDNHSMWFKERIGHGFRSDVSRSTHHGSFHCIVLPD